MKSPLRTISFVGSLLLFGALAARADQVAYSFEQLALNATTPITNLAPDIGSSAFRTSFTAPAGSFSIQNQLPNNLFSGQYLAGNGGIGALTLSVVFNTPVTAVTFAFATFANVDTITFVSASGTKTMASSSQAGGTGRSGGTFNFGSATSFTSFTLVDTFGQEAPFSIDNLTATYAGPSAVPESGQSFLLLGLAASSLFAAERLQRARRA